MDIKGTQLFIRGTGEEGKYLVCGLLRTDQKLPLESVITGTGFLSVLLTEDREGEAMGIGLDDIMTAPFWRLK